MARSSTKGLVAGALIRVKNAQRKFARGEFIRTFEHATRGMMVEYRATYNLTSRYAPLKDVVLLRRQSKRPGKQQPRSAPQKAPLAMPVTAKVSPAAAHA